MKLLVGSVEEKLDKLTKKISDMLESNGFNGLKVTYNIHWEQIYVRPKGWLKDPIIVFDTTNDLKRVSISYAANEEIKERIKMLMKNLKAIK